MRGKFIVISMLVFIVITMVYSGPNAKAYNTFWPMWRGPLQTGEAPEGNPPVTWSETENIQWKIEIPGKGLSTPVIWGDRLFVTTAIETDEMGDPETIQAIEKEQQQGGRRMSRRTKQIHQFVVYAIDRHTGKIIWKKEVNKALPHQGTHRDGSFASPSCVTDGEVLVASFGSFGLYVMDLDGNLLWEKDLGDLNIRKSFGEGGTPALYQDHLIVVWDHEDQSFITVLDAKTGKTMWKQDRNERSNWSTPIVQKVNGKPQIIVPGNNNSIGYDLENGDEIWTLKGQTQNIVPVPMYQDGIAYLISGFRGAAVQAVDLAKAKDAIDNSEAVIWQYDQGAPYVPSALLYKNGLYFLKGNRETLTCLDSKTGTVHYTGQKLEGMKGVYASPVAAAGRIYIAGRNGATSVLEPGPTFKKIAQNVLDDRFDASPAIVGNQLYLRGLKSIYCISE